MTCETCRDAGDYGTVYFDHKARRWRHTEKPGMAVCNKPFPAGVSSPAPERGARLRA